VPDLEVFDMDSPSPQNKQDELFIDTGDTGHNLRNSSPIGFEDKNEP
jgi:hypothetical protein